MADVIANLAMLLADKAAEAIAYTGDLPVLSKVLDDLIAAQADPKPARADVIRKALTEHLKAKGYLK